MPKGRGHNGQYWLNLAASVLLGGVLCPSPAGAQVVVVVENGRRVFVNEPAGTPREPLSDVENGPARSAPAPASSARTGRGNGSGTPPAGLLQLAQATAERHQVDPALVHALIEAESSWDPQAVSPKGALGLMQLIPATAQRFGVADPFDARQNLDGGVRYLRQLLERYNGDLQKALAAYNAGEGAVDRVGGVPNYAETVRYVRKVMDAYFAPSSGRQAVLVGRKRPLYRIVDARGRIVITNE